MITDLDLSTEYVDIYLYGTQVGASCNPSGVTQGSCNWYTCIGPNTQTIQATSSSLNVELRYSSEVNAIASCTDSCRTGHAVARVKLGIIYTFASVNHHRSNVVNKIQHV